ncbi:MAG: aldehyde dehydrogenase, partial [Proteobacteria bacterium]|nr:aldehyde dehydrogenase [Pseudomonadota bacterium]
MNHPPIDSISAEAIDLAAAWHERSLELLTLKERAIQGRLKGLLNNPIDKVMMVKMIDRSFRSGDAARTAEQINDLFRQYGIPGFFSGLDTVLIRLFLGVGRFFPRLVVPLVIGKMRKDSSHTIVQGESGVLGVLLRKRKKEGVRMNLNHLGEAVLGEEEALSRLEIYLQDLKNPWIECISVKISTIYSQIVSLAFEHTVDILTERLSRLYRTAKSHRFVRRDGTRVPKMVNLDME